MGVRIPGSCGRSRKPKLAEKRARPMACALSGAVDTTHFGSRIADGPRACTILEVVDESGGLERENRAVLLEIGSYGRARNDKT